MSRPLPVGPYKKVDLGDGRTAPWYIIPFDKHGTCTGPMTRQDLIRTATSEDFTDIFLFSHGWNNDWEVASSRYDDFVRGLIQTRREHGAPTPENYRPLLVGVFWPSTALVMPWEEEPNFASEGTGHREAGIGEFGGEVEALADELPTHDRAEFYRLAQSESLDRGEALRLATLVKKVTAGYGEADQDLAGRDRASGAPELSAEDLVAAWKEIPTGAARTTEPGEFGYVADDVDAPEAAFDLGFLDPRGPLRLATVLQMKDRAARVGGLGVGPLLRDLGGAARDARVHLVGHSYGCIVVLSALCSSEEEADPPPFVESVLLLQPAVSQWCFAGDVAGRGYSGGYRSALQRVRKPIFATFSRNDLPLRRAFHLAVRRGRDLGQPRIAGAGLPTPPSLYAALGGYGPQGLSDAECQVLKLNAPPRPYQIRSDPVPEVCAVDGDVGIGGHGDISNPMTWWTMLSLIEAAPAKRSPGVPDATPASSPELVPAAPRPA